MAVISKSERNNIKNSQMRNVNAGILDCIVLSTGLCEANSQFVTRFHVPEDQKIYLSYNIYIYSYFEVTRFEKEKKGYGGLHVLDLS